MELIEYHQFSIIQDGYDKFYVARMECIVLFNQIKETQKSSLIWNELCSVFKNWKYICQTNLPNDKNNSHLHLPNWIFHNFQVLWMDIQNNFLIQTSFQKISFLKGIFRGYWSNGCGIQKSPHSRFNSIFHNTLLKNSGNIIKLHTAYHLSFKTEYLCYPQQKTKIHTHYTYNITATKKYN